MRVEESDKLFPDASLLIAQSYLLAPRVDTYVARVQVAQTLDSALRLPLESSRIGVLASRIYTVGCAASEYLSSPLVPEKSKSLAAAIREMESGDAVIRLREVMFGIRKAVEPQQADSQCKTHRDLKLPWMRGAVAELVALKITEQWQRRANTLEASCRFRGECLDARGSREEYNRALEEMDKAIDEGIPVAPPAKLWATISMSRWTTENLVERNGVFYVKPVGSENVKCPGRAEDISWINAITTECPGAMPTSLAAEQIASAQFEGILTRGGERVKRAFSSKPVRLYLSALSEARYWLAVSEWAAGLAAVNDARKADHAASVYQILRRLAASPVCVRKDDEQLFSMLAAGVAYKPDYRCSSAQPTYGVALEVYGPETDTFEPSFLQEVNHAFGA